MTQIKSRGTEYTLFSNGDILRLILPLFAEQFLFFLVGAADTVMVATLGEASVSAVSLADMFNGCIHGIFFALATGGAVVVSQCIGAAKLSQARESARQLLIVAFLAGIGVTLLTEIFLKDIIRFLYGRLEPDVYAATLSYFRITLATIPFVAVYGACAALFRSMNRTKITMYISFAANIVNVLGNALLIYVFHLGVAGAAYATLVSRILSMIVLLMLSTNSTNLIYVRFQRGFFLTWSVVRRILYFGIPGGIENGVFQFGRVLVLGLIAKFGTREIAANALANMIDYISTTTGQVFSLAVVTVIGRAVGVGDIKQIRYYVKKMMRWAVTSHFIWNILLFLLTPMILRCFGKIDADTRRLAFYLILIHNGLGIFLWPHSFVFPNILRSVNDVRFPMILSVFSMFLVRVGCGYMIAGWIHSGVLAVWIAMVLDWIVRIIGFQLRYRSNAWVTLCQRKRKEMAL